MNAIVNLGAQKPIAIRKYGHNPMKKPKKVQKNIPSLLLVEIELLRKQNDILGRNTIYTAGGVVVSFVALIIALIALLK